MSEKVLSSKTITESRCTGLCNAFQHVSYNGNNIIQCLKVATGQDAMDSVVCLTILLLFYIDW